MDLRFIVALVAGVLAIAVVLLAGTGTVPGVVKEPQTLPAPIAMESQAAES